MAPPRGKAGGKKMKRRWRPAGIIPMKGTRLAAKALKKLRFFGPF